MKANPTHYISNPAPKVWHVIPVAAWVTYRVAFRTFGYNAPETERAYRHAVAQAVATFTTRRDARAYVESIGGTWK